MGAGVLISAVVAVLVSVICVVCGLSLASRRWAEMRTQLAQEAQAEWGRRGALWGRQLDDTLAPMQRVFGLLGDKTWADLRAECVAEALAAMLKERPAPADKEWQTGDAAVRSWVMDAMQVSGAEMQRQQQALTTLQAALEARGAAVRRLAEKVDSLATEQALVQPETVAQLAAQLGALEAALKQYEADWSKAKVLEQKVFERLVRRMEPMVAADVRAAQAELEAYFGEMWPRPRHAQRRPFREASRVAHAG